MKMMDGKLLKDDLYIQSVSKLLEFYIPDTAALASYSQYTSTECRKSFKDMKMIYVRLPLYNFTESVTPPNNILLHGDSLIHVALAFRLIIELHKY